MDANNKSVHNPVLVFLLTAFLLYSLWSVLYFPFGFFRLSFRLESYPMLYGARILQVLVFTGGVVFYAQCAGWASLSLSKFVLVGALLGIPAHLLGNLTTQIAYAVQMNDGAFAVSILSTDFAVMLGVSLLLAILAGTISSGLVCALCWVSLSKFSGVGQSGPNEESVSD